MNMWIYGESIGFKDREKIDIYNPATLEIIDSVPVANEKDINLAIECALNEFENWSKTLMFERIKIIRKFADLLEKEYEEIAQIESKEMGKPITQARNEVKGAGETARQISEYARTIGGEVLPISNLPSAGKDLLLTIREPYGVVAAVVPFNYPISQCILKIVPALLMGNTVIVKPASEAPLSNIMLIELLYKAGMPPKAIQIVTGSGSKIGRMLATDPRISVISLTGSTRTGIEIAKRAAETLKHVLLELGGNDPLIILRDADIEYAVSEAVIGRYGCSGQICCGSKRFIVPRELKSEFIQKLAKKIKEKKFGDPSEETTEIGPLVSESAAKHAEKQIEIVVAQGGKIIMGGNRFKNTYIEPTIIEVNRDNEIAKDMEIFAPVWPIIVYDTIEEAIQIANQTCYGLSAGCIGNNYQELLRIAKEVKAGCVVMNGCGNYQTKDQAFGGVKMSGNAREGGHYVLEEFSQITTIVFRKAFDY